MPQYRQQWKVQGSAKDPYTISVTYDDVWSCSCMGWVGHMPRKDCKHIKEKKLESQSPQQSPRKTTERAHVVSGMTSIAGQYPSTGGGTPAPTAKSAIKAGASKDEAADVARVKREEVQAKKDAKLGKMRYGFQLAFTYEPADLNSGRWVAEIKYDGELAMWIDGRLINRSGNDVTHRFPEIRPATDAVLVGELVVTDASDISHFNKIQERNTDDALKIALAAKTNPATFMVFDILEVANHDMTRETFGARRNALEGLQAQLGELGQRVRLVEQIPVTSDKEVQLLVNKCRELETEGMMLKNLACSYAAKRNRNWVKCKTWQETELPILRWEDTGVGDGFVIYVQLKTGREQRVVVNGFKDREAVKTGIGARKSLVAEIKFLSESKEDGALRFPSFRRLVQVNEKRLIP